MTTFILPDYIREHYASEARNRAGLDGTVELLSSDPSEGATYEELLRQAFYFLRRHDDGRYSSRTKMRVLNAAEAAEAARVDGVPPRVGLPGVMLLRQPYEFDEATEVKKGGIIGAVVCWPDEAGRTVLAVHQQKRRAGLGSVLLQTLRDGTDLQTITSWVNTENVVAQQFMLSRQMRPAQVNSSGGIQYVLGYAQESDDGAEDHVDPLMSARPRPRRGRPERDVYVTEPVLTETQRDLLRQARFSEAPVFPELDDYEDDYAVDAACGCDECVADRREAAGVY